MIAAIALGAYALSVFVAWFGLHVLIEYRRLQGVHITVDTVWVALLWPLTIVVIALIELWDRVLVKIPLTHASIARRLFERANVRKFSSTAKNFEPQDYRESGRGVS